MMKHKIVFFLISIAFLTACKQQKAEPIQVLQAATQEVEVFDLVGLEELLSKKDDKIHVINFWATWCAPCIKEIPHFEQVNQEMADDVEVVLVSIDQESDYEKLINLVNKKEWKSNIAVVSYDSDEKFHTLVSANWQAGGVPVTLIYNKNKRYFIEGSVTHEELLAEIEKFKS